MTDELYDIGDVVRITASFTDANDALADPNTVALEVRSPTGAITSYPNGAPEIIKDAVGKYHLDYVPAAAGQWRYEWRSTGTAQAAQQGDFEVRERISATGDLCTISAVRRRLQDDTEQLGDPLLADIIAIASRVITRECRREFAPPTATAQERSFLYRGGGYLNLSPYDLRGTPTAVTLDTHLDAADHVELTGEDYTLNPEPPELGVYEWLELHNHDVRHGARPRRITINGQWGFAKVPEDVAHWCALTVVLWIRDSVSAFSTTFDLEQGRLEVPEHLPSAVRYGLRDYKRRSVG